MITKPKLNMKPKIKISGFGKMVKENELKGKRSNGPPPPVEVIVAEADCGMGTGTEFSNFSYLYFQ